MLAGQRDRGTHSRPTPGLVRCPHYVAGTNTLFFKSVQNLNFRILTDLRHTTWLSSIQKITQVLKINARKTEKISKNKRLTRIKNIDTKHGMQKVRTTTCRKKQALTRYSGTL